MISIWKSNISICLLVFLCTFCPDSEEATVMANLRKRVAACDLEKKRPLSDASRTSESNQDDLDNRPLLSKVCVLVNAYNRISLNLVFCWQSKQINWICWAQLVEYRWNSAMENECEKMGATNQRSNCFISEFRPHFTAIHSLELIWMTDSLLNEDIQTFRQTITSACEHVRWQQRTSKLHPFQFWQRHDTQQNEDIRFDGNQIFAVLSTHDASFRRISAHTWPISINFVLNLCTLFHLMMLRASFVTIFMCASYSTWIITKFMCWNWRQQIITPLLVHSIRLGENLVNEFRVHLAPIYLHYMM